MTLDEAGELITYLNRHPTASDILTVVYDVKPKNKPWEKIDEGKFYHELYSDKNVISSVLGPTNSIPDEVREDMKWVEEQMAKMHKNKVN